MYKKSGAKGNTAVRRLMTEYKQLINDGPDGISAGPIDEEYAICLSCLSTELTEANLGQQLF